MDAQAEFAATRQTTAEIDALRQLWSNVLPGAAPSRDSIHAWLKSLPFFEVGKCMHATQRLNQKYKGKLKQRQLTKYMEQCVNNALKENYGTDSK